MRKTVRKQTDRNSDALARLFRWFGNLPSTEKTLLAAAYKVDSNSESWEIGLPYSHEIILLGNFREALDDATVSVQLAPTSIEAIEIGKFYAFPETCRNCLREWPKGWTSDQLTIQANSLYWGATLSDLLKSFRNLIVTAQFRLSVRQTIFQKQNENSKFLILKSNSPTLKLF